MDFYLIPQPGKITERAGKFIINFDTGIILDAGSAGDCFGIAALLQKSVSEYAGIKPLITKAGSSSDRASCFVLEISDGIRENGNDCQQQGYRLEISEKKVCISGYSRKGLLYGVQTLRQIICQCGASLPCLYIEDAPAIPVRGFYHDVTRGRVPKLSYLKKLADRMAFYKLNQLQIYVEHSYLFAGMSELWRDSTPLTAEDILELDEYCKKLEIELVPSLSSFGHLYELLRTKQYRHFCELEEPGKEKFSLVGRMAHHTMDVSSAEGMELIKAMISEYMDLFSSRKFNICADETFDLGRGKNRERAQREGIKGMYMEYVRQLCAFVVEKGRQPMFWGDIICDFPEEMEKLPENTICLNWGYEPQQPEDGARKLYEVGAQQYLCPGVAGWNQIVNRLEDSYENIRRMCGYAVKYGAQGVLNTDWGDYGHINHPEFSVPGLIYGAAFSWNETVPDFEEINRKISKLEYADGTEKLLCLVCGIDKNKAFDWNAVVRFREAQESPQQEEVFRNPPEGRETDFSDAGKKNSNLACISSELAELTVKAGQDRRGDVAAWRLAIRGIQIWNSIGGVIGMKRYGMKTDVTEKADVLASQLEEWFYHYKNMWRSVSRESELYRLQDIIDWYADLLREM